MTQNLARPPRPATINALANGLDVPVTAIRAARTPSRRGSASLTRIPPAGALPTPPGVGTGADTEVSELGHVRTAVHSRYDLESPTSRRR